jgi:hypothetical protein
MPLGAQQATPSQYEASFDLKTVPWTASWPIAPRPRMRFATSSEHIRPTGSFTAHDCSCTA